MKILICITEYYPLQNANVNCVINIIKKLREHNSDLDIDVLTFKESPENLDIEEYMGTTIHRMYDIRMIHRKKYFAYCDGKPFSLIRKLLFGVKKRISKYCMRHVKTPCRGYYKRILDNMEKLYAQKQYDVVMSVSGGFSAAFAGAKFKQKHPEVCLLTYFLDPLVGNYVYRHFRPDYVAADQEFIFKHSDRVVVTPVIYAHTEKADNIIPVEFPSFFEDDVVTENCDNICFDKEKINLLYTGIFYKDIRNPDYLMRLLSGTDEKVVLHICGHMELAFEMQYRNMIRDGKIVLHGNVSHEIMYNAIMEADYLVNVGNSSDMFLPSKLISYISTGKPIINLYQIKDCPTLKYMEKYRNNVNLYQGDSLEHNIALLNQYISRPVSITPKALIFETYKECTTEYVVEKGFAPLFGNVDKQI